MTPPRQHLPRRAQITPPKICKSSSKMFAYETNANFHPFIARVGGNQPPTPKRKTISLFPLPPPTFKIGSGHSTSSLLKIGDDWTIFLPNTTNLKIAYERGNFPSGKRKTENRFSLLPSPYSKSSMVRLFLCVTQWRKAEHSRPMWAFPPQVRCKKSQPERFS